MFKKLRIRLTLLCAVSTGLVLLGMALFSLRFMLVRMDQQNFADFENSEKNIAIYINTSDVLNHATLNSLEKNNSLILGVYTEHNPTEFTKNNPLRETITKEALIYSEKNSSTTSYSFQSGTVFQMEYEKETFWVAIQKVSKSQPTMTLVMIRSTNEENAEKKQVIFTILFVFFLFLILLCLISYIFIGHSIKPIEESQKRQQTFVSSASHELRSPISVILATTGVLKFSTEEKKDYFLEKIENECDRMSDLIASLLELATLENAKKKLTREPLNPTKLILETKNRYQSLANEKKIHLFIEPMPEKLPFITGNPSLISEVLSIYLENAIQYTPLYGTIKLGISSQKQKLVFFVEDTGSGIIQGKEASLFERFYQEDKSRTEKKHFGLGLSIAKEIVEIHGGKVFAENRKEGGARFSFSLPIESRGKFL